MYVYCLVFAHHTIVWLLMDYSQRILTYYTLILFVDLTYGRTMAYIEDVV